MANLIQLSDFVGFHALPRSTAKDVVLQAYIDKYEKKYLNQLMGKTLCDLFVADISNYAPQAARFIAIYNAFTQLYGSETLESEGMKELLLSLIYYHYITGTDFNPTQSGGAGNVADAARMAGHENNARIGERKYNNAIATWEAIQYKMSSDAATYPEYVGQKLEPVLSWLL